MPVLLATYLSRGIGDVHMHTHKHTTCSLPFGCPVVVSVVVSSTAVVASSVVVTAVVVDDRSAAVLF